jgi:hypothetical protein
VERSYDHPPTVSPSRPHQLDSVAGFIGFRFALRFGRGAVVCLTMIDFRIQAGHPGWCLAVEQVCAAGVLTPDLGDTASTKEATRAVCEAIRGVNIPSSR